MKETKADVILHPIRMRIIQTFISGQRLTVQQIADKLPDIPQATLYRHLNRLLKANVIEVVEENPIRGAVEKVYALPENAGMISPDEIANWTKDDHMDSFIKFMSIVLADFERYVNQEQFDFVKDGAGYQQISFYATDEEYVEFIGELNHAVAKVLSNKESNGRRRRTLATIVTTENREGGEEENGRTSDDSK